ncbi:helix-turn-helix transcriptional regulator [Pediococcus pentosaceus]|uniref:helix-turn-helix transcriptional regulator n=1 Tax=Pediococcus pentosaceus TaxID=1255 RepID=UPI0018A18CE2|nr:helix-turn-helix transcriptional regulator [Pediococcus pentosaceus]MBF7128346.1 helix-turn-helix transcriptional regulator [Pediococcus pentosaceus]MBF7132727.1 helix-turn-helix transcriptional regulator [Pediococcus pentosaceus]
MIQRTWLKDYRDHFNYTQSDIAELLGVAVTTYASYEQGYRTPKVTSAKRYADKMKIDWNYFFTEDVRISYDKKEVTA